HPTLWLAGQSHATGKAHSRPPALSPRGRNASAARGIGAGRGYESCPHRCRSLPPLCWYGLADHRSAPATARFTPMRNFPGPVQSPLAQSSLLGSSFTQRTVLVCPPLSSQLCWHASTSHLSFPCLLLTVDSLLLCLPPPALLGSVTIGRGQQ